MTYPEFTRQRLRKDTAFTVMGVLCLLLASACKKDDYTHTYPIGTKVVFKHYDSSYHVVEPMTITGVYWPYTIENMKKDYNYYKVIDATGHPYYPICDCDVREE